MDKERRAYYLKHIYGKSAKIAELKRQKKIHAVEYKGGKCSKCNGTFPPCVYDFHHTDPDLKKAEGSQFLNWTWERIKGELDKCVLLCANCHRLEHYQEEKEHTMTYLSKDLDTKLQQETDNFNDVLASKGDEDLAIAPAFLDDGDVVQTEEDVGEPDLTLPEEEKLAF